jgi:methylated-DNA-protein-cysteine methyltransferase-like protein
MSVVQLRPGLEAEQKVSIKYDHFRLLKPTGRTRRHNMNMARSDKSFAELFQPHRAERSRTRRFAAIDDNPAIQLIWDVISAIPRGQVSSYGAVARAAGFPGRARLTGFALRVAPDDRGLPWHRVVGAGGRIVFLKSSLEHREQAKRLRAEGVAIKDGRVHRSFIANLEGI